MSQKSKLDPRAKRSREWMTAALLELIREKPYEKISITDITDRAGLSRPTFYLHYQSKDDILISHLDSLFDPILDEFHELRQNAAIGQPGSLALTNLFSEVNLHIEAFRTAFQAGAEKQLIERMHQRNVEYLRDLAKRCEMNISNEVITLSAQYMAGALVGIFIHWIQSDDPHPPGKMGEFITEVTRPILRTVICNGELDYIFF